MATKQNFINAIAISLNLTLKLLWKVTSPSLSQISEEGLQLWRRCATRIVQKLKTRNSAISVEYYKL
jgi:hypothetical protein